MRSYKFIRWFRIGAAALFMTVAICSFAGVAVWCAYLMSWRFAPALLSFLATFSAGALAALLTILILTFIAGRFYCSIFCPWGILQELIAFIFRRKKCRIPDLPWCRYLIAGIVYGLLISAWHAGFMLLDPYSNFGRSISDFSLGATLPLIVIVVLAAWKKRLFCTAICPVGTLLGLVSKWGIFKLAITGKCVKCGKCTAACPADCIDIDNGGIDNERCLRCMECVVQCPLHSINFTAKKTKKAGNFDNSRRRFIINAGALIAGGAAAMVLAKTALEKVKDFAVQLKFLPPGAGDAEDFAAKCTACQLCVVNCPADIIVPADNGFGPVSLDFSQGHCLYDCNNCTQVCPTDALLPLSLETKQRTKIAEAKFNARNCIVFQEGEKCGKCADACPVHAIVLRKSGAPRPVKKDICIGCGACHAACPAPKKAMTMQPVEQQTLIKTPEV